MKYTKLGLLALVAVLAGCEEYFEKKDSEPDGSKPYIAIMAPANNSVFSNTQAIKIESVVSDKDKVKEIEVQIVQLAPEAGQKTGTLAASNSKPVWSFKNFPAKNPVVIDTALAAANLPAGKYLLTLHSIDNRTNVGTKEVHFTVK